MMNVDTLPRYDRFQTYAWNYEHAPQPVAVQAVPVRGTWDFCGLRTGSPLGVAAGPLLNGRWCLYYASLGFDVLTYKTVRSGQRACYELPNLQPVRCEALTGAESEVSACQEMQGSWAVSYGMPSKPPDVWRADVEWTRRQLPPTQRLCVSTVGTVQAGWTIDDLAVDYARCATWAVDSGADAVEINLSCPNVSTCDGQLYQRAADAAVVAAQVRAEIGHVPLIAKIGHLRSAEEAECLLESLAPLVSALSMTNSLAARVLDEDRQFLFDGQKRGICGEAIRAASVEQIALMARILQRRGWRTRLIGVGGVSKAEDVQRYLAAGAHAVHIATAAMINPAVALEIRRGLASG